MPQVMGLEFMNQETGPESPTTDRRWVPIVKLASNGASAPGATDCVAVEAPLEIRLHGRPAAVLMRTPGFDKELVTGFLFCEGVISDPGQITSFDLVEDSTAAMGGSVVDIRLDAPSRGRGIDRFFYNTSSCGACGKRSIGSLEVPGVVTPPFVSADLGLAHGIMAVARANQPLFSSTGGSHASALFDQKGNLLTIREDVGRHNALDKVIGAMLLSEQVPLANHILAISGRVGYEIIQKAAAAGIPAIVAVGAPTSLAVSLAGVHGVTLAGFVRDGSMNIYNQGATP